MKKTLVINVGGKELPCRLTMGAMLHFKRCTGRDVSQVFGDSVKSGEMDFEDMLMFMWCCIVCASKADGIEFDMDFETFVCHITPQDVNQWNEAMSEGNSEKKSEAEP